jgi:glycosyltransferase involved in cell wall biosynthesis
MESTKDMDQLSANISVIMPVYNAKNYVSAAIHSILQQSICATEFIIVDDASTDGTSELLKLFAQKYPFIKLIRLGNRLGQERRTAKALNKALDVAAGNYIAWMDADDLADPTRFEKQLKFLQAHTKIDACGSFAEIVSDNTRQHGRLLTKPLTDEALKVYTVWQSPFFQSSVMMKAASLGKDRYDESYAYAEDYEFFSRLAKRMQLANLPEPLLFYRMHDKQSIHQQEFIIDIERTLKREAQCPPQSLENHLCLFDYRTKFSYTEMCQAVRYASQLKAKKNDTLWHTCIDQALLYKFKRVMRKQPIVAFRLVLTFPRLVAILGF